MFVPTASVIVDRTVRQRRELDDITELKFSIAKRGQIQPIVVKDLGQSKYELIVGERRLRACIELGREVEVKLWNDLTPLEAKIVELEENLRRNELPWRDQVQSIANIHNLLSNQTENWTAEKSAEHLGCTASWIYVATIVNRHLDTDLLKDAQGINHAYGLLQRQAERKTASIVNEIVNAGASASASNFAVTLTTSTLTSNDSVVPISNGANVQTAPPPTAPPVSNASFLQWVLDYTGPKFNLIHCDFPFGIKFTGGYGQEEDGIKYESTEDDYWTLVDCLCTNTERLASYSSHLMFWFSMSFYTETCRRLRAAGWKVQDHPLIWFKSDGQGIIPGRNEYPRRVYETALLASRGSRPLVKMTDNCYACPRASNALHPSQKPEPMLRHFLAALTDSTTDFLDPTCGSGSALRAAEDVGARSVLGLELDPDFAKAANAATLNARMMRRMAL